MPVVTTTSPLPTKFQIVSARGKTLDLRVGSSTSAGPTTSADVSFAGTKVNFLWHQSTESGYEAAEVIAVKGALSDSDLGKVSAYLKAKYNLP